MDTEMTAIKYVAHIKRIPVKNKKQRRVGILSWHYCGEISNEIQQKHEGINLSGASISCTFIVLSTEL